MVILAGLSEPPRRQPVWFVLGLVSTPAFGTSLCSKCALSSRSSHLGACATGKQCLPCWASAVQSVNRPRLHCSEVLFWFSSSRCNCCCVACRAAPCIF